MVVTVLFSFTIFFTFYILSDFSPVSIEPRVSETATISLTVEAQGSLSSSSESSSSGGGGGGGGGASVSTDSKKADFNVYPTEFNLLVESGEESSEQLTVKNTGQKTIGIEAVLQGIDKIASLDKSVLTLKDGEEANLSLIINAPESGVHAGKIIFTSGSIKKEVLVLVNVQGGLHLFDVLLTILSEYRIVEPGEKTKSFVSIDKIGAADEVNVTATYTIKDFSGNTYFEKSEEFSVLDEKSFTKEFSTQGLPLGRYVLGLEIVYSGGFATSSAMFSLEEKKFGSLELFLLWFLSFLAFILIIYSILKYKKSKRYIQRGHNKLKIKK